MPTREAWTICAIAIISGLRCVDYRDYDSARAKWPRQQRTFFSSSSLVIVHKPLSDVLDCSHWPSRHGDSGVFLFPFFYFCPLPFHRESESANRVKNGCAGFIGSFVRRFCGPRPLSDFDERSAALFDSWPITAGKCRSVKLR